MTEDEYNELKKYLKNVETISSGKENLEIINDGKSISFKSKGKLSIYNYIQIFPNENKIRIGDSYLLFSDSVNVKNENNALKSKWKGYTWRFEFPENASTDIIKNIENVQFKSYKFTIGVLEKTGHIFIQTSGDEIDNGVRKVSFDLPIIFK